MHTTTTVHNPIFAGFFHVRPMAVACRETSRCEGGKVEGGKGRAQLPASRSAGIRSQGAGIRSQLFFRSTAGERFTPRPVRRSQGSGVRYQDATRNHLQTFHLPTCHLPPLPTENQKTAPRALHPVHFFLNEVINAPSSPLFIPGCTPPTQSTARFQPDFFTSDQWRERVGRRRPPVSWFSVVWFSVKTG